jgi:phosphohistidine phosphatase
VKRDHELYLIRHGLAEEHGPAWPDDSKRPLSEQGVTRLRRSARGLKQLEVTFDVILTSPLVRARQTADVIAAASDPMPPLVVVEALAPGGAQAAVLGELEKHAKKTRIAIVGHEPGIGELAARLIGLRHTIEFKKGAVCRIDVDTLPPTTPGALRWLLPPRVLRSIRR